MTRIAVTDGGTYFHKEAFAKPPFATYIDDTLYLPEIADAEFSKYDAIIVSCRSNPRFLTPLKQRWLNYLQQGGTLIVFAESAVEQWIPGIEYHQKAVNFWWWLEKGAKHDIRPCKPDHSLYEYLSHADMTWHYHGTYTPPEDADILLQHPDGSAVLFDDKKSYNGRLIVSSLDPGFHHGSYFMPATSRFLQGFFPWLKSELAVC